MKFEVDNDDLFIAVAGVVVSLFILTAGFCCTYSPITPITKPAAAQEGER